MDKAEQTRFFYALLDSTLPRLGPGDNPSTDKALGMIFSAAERSCSNVSSGAIEVLDIGCGNGAQTIQLAKALSGPIIALDSYWPYLEELRRRADAQGVGEKIRLCHSDMRDHNMQAGAFDIIWSEGALYHLGFASGLAECHRLLAPGGFLGVSELCWLHPDPPDACRRFFAAEYPDMIDIDGNLALIHNAGFHLTGHFTLPESAWLDPYYLPLEARLKVFGRKYADDPERMAVIHDVQAEIDLFRKHVGCYGYVFYVMQKPGG